MKSYIHVTYMRVTYMFKRVLLVCAVNRSKESCHSGSLSSGFADGVSPLTEVVLSHESRTKASALWRLCLGSVRLIREMGLQSAGSVFRCLQQLGQPKARNQEFRPDQPCGCQEPKNFSYHLLPLRHISRVLECKAQAGLDSRYSDMEGRWFPSADPTHGTMLPPQISLYYNFWAVIWIWDTVERLTTTCCLAGSLTDCCESFSLFHQKLLNRGKAWAGERSSNTPLIMHSLVRARVRENSISQTMLSIQLLMLWSYTDPCKVWKWWLFQIICNFFTDKRGMDSNHSIFKGSSITSYKYLMSRYFTWLPDAGNSPMESVPYWVIYKSLEQVIPQCYNLHLKCKVGIDEKKYRL